MLGMGFDCMFMAWRGVKEYGYTFDLGTVDEVMSDVKP
jgi:hypothetical protein